MLWFNSQFDQNSPLNEIFSQHPRKKFETKWDVKVSRVERKGTAYTEFDMVFFFAILIQSDSTKNICDLKSTS